MKIHPIGLRAFLLTGAALALGSAAPGISTTPAAGSVDVRCAAMISLALGEDVEITSATRVAASPRRTVQEPFGERIVDALPSHCQVEGVIDRRQGAAGKEYGIRFALALPDDWSGRFLLQGGGGLNGAVVPPTGPVASDGRPALARGFAVISSDSGHQGTGFDATFMADQRAALDFAEASVRTVALLGKRITSAYYARSVGHSYMTGCSTGGREAMLASQRYPELFDGIIAGAPAMRTGDSNLAIQYTQVLMNQVAPKGANGLPDVGQLLTPAVRKTLTDGMLNQCDALDGLEDGLVENLAQCRFRPKELQCGAGQTENCISPALAGALEVALEGPRDKAGYPIYTPFPFDTGTADPRFGYLPTGASGPFGPGSTATSIDLDARIHEIRQNAAQRLTDTHYWTNLNTYLERGGKLMFFHGVSDFWFSPFATWDYYQRAAQTNGPAFTDASRVYMVPGMLHCQGGNAFDQFDMLGALVDWVEEGKAPEAVTAHRSAPADQTRPLCPYPSHARYVGGDPGKADSFRCTPPQS